MKLQGDALLYFVTAFASLGVFLFGYDQGVVSGIITGDYFKQHFDYPSPAQIGTMVAVLELGALASSLLVGHLGERWGRKRTITYGAIVFVVGGFVQTVANKLRTMICGRVVSGLGVGLLSTTVPVYQSEISPPYNRGRLSCVQFSMNILGYAVSVWAGYFSSYFTSNLSWRVPLFLQCLIGLLLCFGSYYLVETPRWLVSNNMLEEGRRTLHILHKNAEFAESEFEDIVEAVAEHRREPHSYIYMWRNYKSRVLIAMSAQMFAQLNGINIISYYAPLVFEQAGWKGRSAILMAGINALVYLAATLPPWVLVDSLGRRKLLIGGGMVMSASLVAVAVLMRSSSDFSANMVIVAVILYNAFFGASWGPVPWLYPPEILPLQIRAKGVSLSTATNWLFNFIVGEVTPSLQQSMKWTMYLIPAGFCIISILTVYRYYPETAGVQLEDMDELFTSPHDLDALRATSDEE